MKLGILLASSIATILCAGGAQATTLAGSLTADDAFVAYISTSNATLGAQIAQGDYWPTTFSFTTALVPGETYYLHIIADNNLHYGTSPTNADGLLGQFDLNGTGFEFSNGTQELLTNTTSWTASANPATEQLLNANGGIIGASIGANVSAWTVPSGSPADEGTNAGPSYWADNFSSLTHPLIASNADWIWSSTDPSGEAFFSTEISPVASDVPEPSAWTMMIIGFAAVGVMTARRKTKAALVAV